MKKIITFIVGIVLLAGVLVLATRQYLGFHYYYKYKEVRSEARSVESSFPELERILQKAVQFSKNPIFVDELSRLYLEMAIVKNEFGTDEERDSYLDFARESLIQFINQNPVDATSYYKMGLVYLLYNYPLLTYVDKARLYFRRALELRPADEFLHLNILFIHLTQWDLLGSNEQNFVQSKLEKMQENNKGFISQLRSKWRKNFGDTEKFKEIMIEIETSQATMGN